MRENHILYEPQIQCNKQHFSPHLNLHGYTETLGEKASVHDMFEALKARQWRYHHNSLLSTQFADGIRRMEGWLLQLPSFIGILDGVAISYEQSLSTDVHHSWHATLRCSR